jgi:hypothetical protein
MISKVQLFAVFFGISFTGAFASAGTDSTCISGNLSNAYQAFKYHCTSNIHTECSVIYQGETFVGFSNHEDQACECVKSRVKSFLAVQTNEALKMQCEDRLTLTLGQNRK